eukprot:6119517-Pyramimonas_sp.AAC.1
MEQTGIGVESDRSGRHGPWGRGRDRCARSLFPRWQGPTSGPSVAVRLRLLLLRLILGPPPAQGSLGPHDQSPLQ